MAKKVINMREVWWVWLGEASAISVASEPEAIDMLLSDGKEYAEGNSFGRGDMACAVVEITWDKPLLNGAPYHKTVCSPIFSVKHNGVIRKCMDRLTPSRLASISKGWYAVKPALSPWWPEQYEIGITSPDVFMLKGKKQVDHQLEKAYPLVL